MPEFSTILDLPAARLSRGDLLDLGRLISDGLPIRPESSKFSLSDGDTTYGASSAGELLNQQLHQSVDRLSFSVHGWKEEDCDIDKSISIRLSRTTASCYISSVEEVWFRGKIQQIIEFFDRHRPWYDKLGGRDRVAFLFGVFGAILFLVIGAFLVIGKYLFAIVAGISAFILKRGYNAFLKGRLFPLIDLKLAEKPRRLSREVLMVIFAGIAAVGTVTTVLIQIMEMVRP